MDETPTPALDRFKLTGEIYVTSPFSGTVYPDEGGFSIAFPSPTDGIFRSCILPLRLTEEIASLIPVGVDEAGKFPLA